MTAMMVTKLLGVRTEESRVAPIACAADSAAIASYDRFPTTLSLIHAVGTPREPESAMTPKRIETAGRTVKKADEVIAFFNTSFFIPILIPAL